jgi:SAM-dependent methyltransferase
MKAEIQALLDKNQGIHLDIGGGEHPQQGFVNMDKRELPTVDIVHDLEVLPWPLPDECCLNVVGSHIWEHLEPSTSIQIMDEIWRVLKMDGVLALSMPYGWSAGYLQDPTHKNPCNENTWAYFDPEKPLWGIYKPKPWHIEKGFPAWQSNGNMEVVMRKISLNGKQ